MDSYQKELAQIKTILKNNPKGMTVTDIARELQTNRNSVAKYLDVMRVSGHVEMITFGPAKVFFPSRRVPMAMLLDYVSDYILVIDKNLRIIQINDTFLNFLGSTRDSLIDQHLKNINLPFISSPEIQSQVADSLNGKESSKEINFHTLDPEHYFIIRFVPTILEDGRHAATIIIQDITQRKIIEDIFQESGDKLLEKLTKLQKKEK